MCIIIENKTKNKLLNLLNIKDIKSCIKRNPDGFGITEYDNKHIKTVKGFGLNCFLEKLKEIEDSGNYYYIHFRKATVGKVCIENNHPFDVLGNNELYLMHNGTLPEFNQKFCSVNQNDSDTKFLANQINYLIRNKDLNYILSKEFRLEIEKIIGDNRVVLISSKHNVIFNEQRWLNHDSGLKFSKYMECLSK